MSEEKFVTVRESDLIELENDARLLYALQSGGVDNWEWYEDSLDSFDEEDTTPLIKRIQPGETENES